ncbi:MAG: hypothetical protein HGA97_12350 [Chlorobiaceae bacterium]|nr:hypothetical protein [Chlorobiaceae bacterium]
MAKEASARIKINKLLENAGWRFFPENGLPANIQLVPKVTIKSKELDALGEDFANAQRGFIDFLLLNDKGSPIIVVEAKSENKEPLADKEQARRYAKSLNCRFVILSNGNLHYFTDLERGNPSTITALPNPDSVIGYQKTISNPTLPVQESDGHDYVVLTQDPRYTPNRSTQARQYLQILTTKGRHVIILCLISLLFLCQHHLESFAATRPIQLDNTYVHELYGHMEYAVDSTGKQTFADILSTGGLNFSLLHGNLNDGYSHKVVWVRFTLLRTSHFPEIAYLRIYPPQLEHVTAYIPSSSSPDVGQASSYQKINTGWQVPFINHPIFNPHIVIPISLPLDKPATVYLRIQSSGPISLGGTIYSLSGLETQTYGNILAQGIFEGLIMAIAVFNFIYYKRTGDAIFLYFFLYGVAVAGSYIAISGILDVLVFSGFRILSEYLVSICFSGEILMFLQIVKCIFNTGNPDNKPDTIPAHRYLAFMSVLAGVNVLSKPLGMLHEFAVILTVASLILFLVILWLSFYYDTTGTPDGVLYLGIVNTLNVAYLVSFLSDTGWIPLLWENNSTFEIGAVVNVVLIPLIMMRRLRAAENKALEGVRVLQEKAVALAKDMTCELREKEAALNLALASERLVIQKKSTFLSMLSHEYRTPLTSISTNLDILTMDSIISDNAMVRIQKMRTAIRRLVNVMDVALERSRLADRHDSSAISRFKFGSFIGTVLSDFRALFSERTITSTIDVGTTEILGDFQLLTTAMLNLLENASKYSKPGSSIELSCMKGDDCVTVKIANQGEPIDSADVEKLFEKYYRGKYLNSVAGAGIGLWMVRGIIDAHSGSIKLESIEERIVVTVCLPINGSSESL